MGFLSATGGTLIGTILPFLVVLTVVVFVHELGHFWVARRTGVVGNLIADIDGKMQRGAQAAGSKELAAAAN